MKRILFLLLASILLVACGETTSEEREVESVNADGSAEEVGTEDSDDATSETEDIGEVIADDEHVKATLSTVEYVKDEMFNEEKYVINIELENKTNDKIIVQARDVSIDGIMVDDMVFFSQEIAGDKKANGKMEIQNFDGDLPSMDDNIEFILLIVNDETFEDIAGHEVKIDF